MGSGTFCLLPSADAWSERERPAAFSGGGGWWAPLLKRSPHTMAAQFERWHLADQFATAKGSKTCLLTVDGKPMAYQPGSWVTCPFGITSWEEDVERKNLEVRCTPELESFFSGLDEWAITYVSQNSNRLLKKQLGEQTIRENYKSPMNKKADYPALLRTKVNTLGPKAVRFWDAHGRSTEQPEDWRAVECSLMLHIRSLWIMGSTFGWTIECSDVQVLSLPHASNDSLLQQGPGPSDDKRVQQCTLGFKMDATRELHERT